jgi:hypothetical protein
MENEGRLISEGSGDNVDGSTNIIPKMDIDLLRQGYRNMLRRIYSPKLYYERIITFLRECEPPRLHIRLDPQNLASRGPNACTIGRSGCGHCSTNLGSFLRRSSWRSMAITFAGCAIYTPSKGVNR